METSKKKIPKTKPATAKTEIKPGDIWEDANGKYRRDAVQVSRDPDEYKEIDTCIERK